MPFVTRKVSDHGTEDPLVARVGYQWVEILPWFNLSEARRTSVLETLLMKVQPHLLSARETAEKIKAGLGAIHKNEQAAPTSAAIQVLAKQFLAEANKALEEFAPVFGLLLGRKAPERNYAALAKWAEKWFGPNDALYLRLNFANSDCIRFLSDVNAHVAKSGALSVVIGGTLEETKWGLAGQREAPLGPYLESFTVSIVPFIEETMVAALTHLTVRSSITLEQIPEADRQKSAPVRYRVMTKAADGKLVPAGKVTQEGTVVPELQRLLQQGRGKPIIASKFNGEWFVASGSQMFHSKKWKNFHDFLLHYIKFLLGGDWTVLEFKKPREERHPLMVWHEDVTRYANAHILMGKNATMTSLVAAYLGLAYNLYLISHNNGKVHEALVKRLKQRDQFYGAYHEAAITGMMIRAGFDIELEDESDRTTSHCEFTATHRASGQKLSVEAKMRQVKAMPEGQKPPQIRWLLGNALKKKANHPRLVFIEVNDETTPPEAQKKLLLDLLATVRGKEADLLIDGQPAPPAYLVVSNNPPATVERPHAPAFMFEGFKIPDFRVEGAYSSLREALDARKKHAAFSALLDSLHEFTRIPVTFDGETQPFAGEKSRGRLLLGKKFRITTPNGDVVGELAHAIVMTDQKAAMCVLRENGRDQMVTVPLSDQEMQAYHESPRTFFGREEQEPKVEDPLKLYDWFYESYKHNSKEALLALFAKMGCKDVEALSAIGQERLAEIFAERTTETIAFQTGLVKPVEQPSRGTHEVSAALPNPTSKT